MEYYCDVYDRTNKRKSINKHLRSRTQISFERGVRLEHTIQNPDCFDKGSTFNEYISIQKKIDLYQLKWF